MRPPPHAVHLDADGEKKKDLFDFKTPRQSQKRKDSGVPTVNLASLMSFSEENGFCYLPHDWPRLQNMVYALCHNIFLHIHRQSSSRKFPVGLRATFG